MNEREEKRMNEVIDKITAEWADRGKIIEGGWWAYVATSGLDKAPELQRQEMRKAYFLGAQHVFASIMRMMDSDREPTERDLRRVDLLHTELESFLKSLVN